VATGDAILNGGGELVGRRRYLSSGRLGDSCPAGRRHCPPASVLRGRARVFDGRTRVFGRRAGPVQRPALGEDGDDGHEGKRSHQQGQAAEAGSRPAAAGLPGPVAPASPAPGRASPGSGPYALEGRDGGTGAAVLADVTHGWLVFLQRLRGAIRELPGATTGS
jgi:hypothetical protein